jgi:ABC-2 type transport system permease protein
MRAISIIFRREMGAYLKSPVGYIIIAAMLLMNGILFYTQALAPGKGTRLSGEVLSKFFMWSSGPTAIGALLLSLRLIAQERQSGSLVLLNTSPVREVEVILGKFFAAFVFLSVATLLSFYLPLLIMVNGKISFAHVLSGYTGLLLLGAACLAIGMFATAIAPDQLVAAVVGGVIAAALYFAYFLAKELDEPLRAIFENIGIWHKNFWPFMRGIVHLKHVFYYLAVVYFFLVLATKTLEARRWK